MKEITTANFERLDIQNCVRGKGVKQGSVVASGKTRLDGLDEGEEGGGRGRLEEGGEERGTSFSFSFGFEEWSFESHYKLYTVLSYQFYSVLYRLCKAVTSDLSSLFAKCRFFDLDFLIFRSLGLHRFAQSQLSLQDRLFVAVFRHSRGKLLIA